MSRIRINVKPYAYIFFLHSLSAILPPLARWKNESLNIWGGAQITLARARGVCAVVRTPPAHRWRAALAILALRLEEGKAVRAKEEHGLVVRAQHQADDQTAFLSASGVMREAG